MRTLLLLIIIFCSANLIAQSDNILWSGIKLQKPLSEKWGLALLPLLRLNEDLGAYQNTSVDYSLRYNISKQWHLQLLGRTWIIPDHPDRQFIWLDVAFKKRYTSLPMMWTNRVRWHNALDLNGRFDADFIRLFTQFRLLNKGKLHPLFGLEMWYQTQGIKDFTRIRIEPGLRYDLSPVSNLLFMLRRQNFINIESPRGDNLWVLVLTFDI